MIQIENIRRWIDVCEKTGIGVPDQVHTLDAYARLLEAKIAHDAGRVEELEMALAEIIRMNPKSEYAAVAKKALRDITTAPIFGGTE